MLRHPEIPNRIFDILKIANPEEEKIDFYNGFEDTERAMKSE
jgi:hypothetical protein